MEQPKISTTATPDENETVQFTNWTGINHDTQPEIITSPAVCTTIYYVVSFMITSCFIVEVYVLQRQKKLLDGGINLNPKEQAQLMGIYDDEILEKARQYWIERLKRKLLLKSSRVILLLGALTFGMLSTFWKWSTSLADNESYVQFWSPISRSLSLYSSDTNEMRITFIFVLICCASECLVMSYVRYWNYVIEFRHGFLPPSNERRRIIMYLTALKNIFLIVAWSALKIIFIMISVTCFVWEFTEIFNGNLLYFLGFVWFIRIAQIISGPCSCFFPSSTLKDGPVKTRLEAMAKEYGFPLDRIFMMKISRYSTRTFVQVSGFWCKKRIVMADTLFEDVECRVDVDSLDNEGALTEDTQSNIMSDAEELQDLNGKKPNVVPRFSIDEIAMIFLIAIGFWKHNKYCYQFSLMLLITADTILMAFLFSWQDLFGAFGFDKEQPVAVKLIIIACLSPYYLYLPASAIDHFSKKSEFAGGAYAVKSNPSGTEQLKAAFIKLYQSNLEPPDFDPLYASIYFRAPTLISRLDALDSVSRNGAANV